MRIVFGISGASGMPLALAALSCISSLPGIETHLVISDAARQTLAAENAGSPFGPEKFAEKVYAAADFSAPPASGSWRHEGMIVCPCSMSSLAAIALGTGNNLLHRAADVTLKERRPLVLVIRETPLNLIHLKNACAATEAGAIIMPFMPAFYTGDVSLPQAMRQFTGRLLDLLNIPHHLCKRWKSED